MIYKINYSFTKIQKGGSKLADFIPYSDHQKMDNEERIKNPVYCPDPFPFLCKDNTPASGLCRNNINHCLKKNIDNVPNKKPLNYSIH